MKILIACEFSGIVRDAFRLMGHDAISCDLLPTEQLGPHIEGDVREVLSQSWDLVIAHPPCTYLCNSGVRWLHERAGRWDEMRKAALFFKQLLYSGEAVCVENPIPHRYAIEEIGRKYTQIIQPWQFGHGETKATCLWLRGLPELIPTDVVEGRQARIHRMSPGPDRSRERSRFYPGIAKAMAQQWS